MTPTTQPLDVYDEVAYAYDGTLEGLLSAIFQSYANKENPTDVACITRIQPRLSQRVHMVETDIELAARVRHGLVAKCGYSAFNAVRKASVSSDPDAGTIAYRFVRYAMDEHKGKARPFSNISHPAVAPLYKLCRSVDNECEHMRQFIRFQHLKDSEVDLWFARCNPRDSVVPLVMGHFVERFSVQPFIIYDETHAVSGVYDGSRWYLVRNDEDCAPDMHLPSKSPEESEMQEAWKRFYKCVSVEARYNPELRRHFMPKRLWRNLTEMQE